MIKNDTEKIKELYRRYLWARDTRDTFRRPDWEKVSKYLSPAHGRFLTSRDNIPAKGKVDRSGIINGTASRAKAIAVAGIKGGLVPHSLKWMKIGLYDEELEAWGPSKDWLYSAERVMYSIFNRSNFYEAIYQPFDEQMTFGTGPFQIDEHPDRIISCDPWTCGEYTLMNGADKVTDTGFREYWITLRALAQKFGEESLSPRSRNMMKNNPDQFISVIHCIMPRDDYDSQKIDSVNMPWASVWFEAKGTNEKILGESGYRSKPVMFPRWMTIGEDPYGSDCPGLQALGDVLQLQRMEKDKLAALAKVVDPPMNVPSNLIGRLKLYPGAQNPVSKDENEQVKPTLAINYDISRIDSAIMRVEDRIKEGFFNDLFLMILNSDKSGTTAYEIAKKNEEKLVLLGPVVERQNNELLTPIIERVFDIAMHRGMIPPPPKELQGHEIRVEYISLLAQAQKAVGVSGIEKTMGFTGQMLGVFPELRHKVDAMRMLDEYADLTGMSPKLIRATEEANGLWQAEQEAIQQQQQQAQMLESAKATQQLSQAQLPGGDNMLGRVMDQLPAA